MPLFRPSIDKQGYGDSGINVPKCSPISKAFLSGTNEAILGGNKFNWLILLSAKKCCLAWIRGVMWTIV